MTNTGTLSSFMNEIVFSVPHNNMYSYIYSRNMMLVTMMIING